MDYNFDELLSKVTDFVKNETRTETVVGAQFTLGEFTCIPVMRLGIGLGAGGGSGEQPKTGKGTGGGAGAGMGIEPMGFLVTKGDQISFVSTHQSSGLSAAFEKLPEMIRQFAPANGKTKAQPVS